MAGGPLPTPALGWESAYRFLAALGRREPDPTVRAEVTVKFIAGMQAGEPIDDWLAEELLRLAALDPRDSVCRDESSNWIAVLRGAGLLVVRWAMELKTELRLAVGTWDQTYGWEHRARIREEVIELLDAIAWEEYGLDS